MEMARFADVSGKGWLSMDVFEKIRAQQGAERTPVWMVGEQLADIIRHDERAQEIVSRDLDQSGMSLADCERKIKAFADKHKTGNFACVIPSEAEQIIREFYGITEAQTDASETGVVLNLEDYF